MKHLIAILVLSVSLFSTQAQCWNSNDNPPNRLSVGMGIGVGSPDYGAVAQLQVEYNISKVHIGYDQTAFLSSSKPAFFGLRVGYEIGSTVSLTPHVGASYWIFDRQSKGIEAAYGSEFTIHLNEYHSADPKLYIDYNRISKYNLFILGFKASF